MLVDQADYEFSYTVECSCDDQGGSLVVRDGRPTDLSSHSDDAEPQWEPLTIETMFDEIDAAISDRLSSIAVSYHPELGYPTLIETNNEGPRSTRRVIAVERLEPSDG